MKKYLMPLMALAAGLFLTACTTPQLPDAAGEFTVHKVYGDHMVLQTGKPIQIAGTATPGKSVKVTLGDQETLAVANMAGNWLAVLPAMEPGGPYTVTVTGNDENKQIQFDDVLIGEVWICSGQSNMQQPVWGDGRFWRTTNGDAEAKDAANYPQIRTFNSTRITSPYGIKSEIEGTGWQVASEESIIPFSATGYYFGRQLNRDLKVPVGLIGSNWGGTRIEPWISTAGFLRANREKETSQILLAGMNKADAEAQQAKLKAAAKVKFEEWEKRFFETYAAETAKAAEWKQPGFDDAAWQSADIPQGSPLESEIDGAVWYRRTIEIPSNWAGQPLTLNLGKIDDCDQTYFNGVQVGAIGTDTPSYWMTPRQYQIPAELVKAGKATIAVRVIDMFGSGGFVSDAKELWIAPAGAAPAERLSLAGPWHYQLEFAAELKKIGNRPTPPDDLSAQGINSPQFPSTLYNSMIAPWTVYPIRGAIWYQGESNAGDAQDYWTLHQLLIEDWRRLWNDPEMPFLFVQLSAFENHNPDHRLADNFRDNREPNDPAWPKLREVQTATLRVPNTGMAVCIDIGDHSDIHPQNKQDVGYRLACEAERICYGRKAISAGPLYDRMEVEGNQIRLHFTNVGAGLKAKDGKLQEFAIAGADGVFVWADARVDGDTVIVSSDKVAEPVAVRYAWSMYPGKANLYNQEGFPASPFRTDTPDYLNQSK